MTIIMLDCLYTVSILNVGGIDPTSNNPFKCVGEAKDQPL